jgi:ADP-ribose pyrophosphatase YjhB (NUDIX family)
MQREYPEAPLVGVGAVIVDEGRVLLVRRGTEPMLGEWTLPGGLVEVGEPLLAGVVREVSEETGLTVEPIELIELLDRVQRDGERVRYHYGSCRRPLTRKLCAGWSGRSGIATVH